MPTQPTPTRRRNAQVGVTLIELLVAMLIVSMCIGLMSGAFFQVGRLVEISTRIKSEVLPYFRKHELAQTAIAALVIQTLPQEIAFRGSVDFIETVTNDHPTLKTTTRTPLRMRILPAVGGFECQVEGVAGGDALTLFNSIEKMEFRYSDMAGKTYERWPNESVSDRLPSLVQVIQPSTGVVLTQWAYRGPVLVDPLRPTNMM